MGVGLETIFDLADELTTDKEPYEAIFRCQLCGEEFVGFRTSYVSDEDIRYNERMHQCEGKDVGVAVLVGFRYNPR